MQSTDRGTAGYGRRGRTDEADLAHTGRLSVYDRGLFARFLRLGPQSVGPGDAHPNDDRVGRRGGPDRSDPGRRGWGGASDRCAGPEDDVPRPPPCAAGGVGALQRYRRGGSGDDLRELSVSVWLRSISLGVSGSLGCSGFGV